MNCNEELVVKLLGKLTLEFNFNWEEQRKIRECIYYSLYGYEVLSLEKSLVASDLKEKIAMYFQIKKLEGYSPVTLKNYFYVLRRFAEWIHKPAATINKNDIRMYLAQTTEDLKPRSKNSVIYALKAFFHWAYDEEIIPINPTKNLATIKVPRRIRKALTLEELELLRLACRDDRERCLVEFIFATGCRISEVVSVNVEDLNMNNNTIKIIGKGNKERLVCFSDKTKIYINNYLNSRKGNNPALFVSERIPYGRMGARGLECVLNRISARTGFKKNIYPHLLRHTMATLSFQSGAKLTTIQRLMGHESTDTTLIYASESEENIQNEYNKHFIQ